MANGGMTNSQWQMTNGGSALDAGDGVASFILAIGHWKLVIGH
jgi:hypothetical protein